MTTETTLDLIELGIVPQSARGIGQTLTLERTGATRRMANGQLRSRDRPSLRKYASSISFNDTYPPAFDGLWSGMTVTVDCAAELSGSAGTAFARTPVPGSVIWRDANGDVVPHVGDGSVAPAGATNYTYRPRLTMMVDSWDLDADEYGAVVSSALNLREV